MGIRITRVMVRDYRGIQFREVPVGRAGLLVSGTNGAGKTSLIEAIRAALVGNGVDPKFIHVGADNSEIQVILDDDAEQRLLTVKRTINRKKTELVVTTDDNVKVSKPQDYLTGILGTAGIDPVAIFHAKPRERRQRVLEAMSHLRVDLAFLQHYVPTMTRMPPGVSLEENGLEVIGKVRQIIYDARTERNAEAKEARRKADDMASKVLAACRLAPDGGPVDVAACVRAHEEARVAARDLELRAEAVDRAFERSKTTRDRIAALRETASAAIAQSKPVDRLEMEGAESVLHEARGQVAQLKAELEKAQTVLDRAWAAHAALEAQARNAAQLTTKANAATEQANELEATLEQTAGLPITADDRTAAAQLVARCQADVEKATRAAERDAARAQARELTAAAGKADEEAATLDEIVKRLTRDAPADLVRDRSGIPGISIDGDDVLLDGVSFETLCGIKRWEVGVDLAKRMNGSAPTKILVCDQLENVAGDELEAFVKYATADGWQLIASRTDVGGIVFEALEHDGAPADAPAPGVAKARERSGDEPRLQLVGGTAVDK